MNKIEITKNRINFKHTYDEKFKNEAKKLGCRWDGVEKTWYAPIKKTDKWVYDKYKTLQNFYTDDEWNIFMEKCLTEPEIEKNEEICDYEFNPALYDFQKDGVKWILKHKNVLIGDEMGLGKTIQVIEYLNIMKNRPVLIVCPLSLKWNWKKEIEKWGTNSEKIYTFDGKNNNDNADIYIINYENLNKWINYLNEKRLKLAVFDEGHYIKNNKAIRTKTSMRIKAEQKIVLTGTPILNKPCDLWSILHILHPDRFTKFWDFALEYCDAKQVKIGGSRHWDISGVSNIEKLRDKLSDIMIRRLKKEVLQSLPEKIRTIIPVEDKKNELKEIEKEVRQALIELAKYKKDKTLREYDNKNTFSVNFAKIEEYRQKVVKIKLPYILEFIDNILQQNEKVVVFTYHQAVYDELRTLYGEQAVGIKGGDKAEERERAIKSFEENDNTKVFIGTIRACGEGITLTRSSNVIFVEYDWTSAKMLQAEDRLHRIGQKNTVNSYWFSVKNSIDGFFIQKIIKKMQIIRDIVGAEEEIFWEFDDNTKTD